MMPPQENTVGECLLRACELTDLSDVLWKALLSSGPLCSVALCSVQMEEMRLVPSRGHLPSL